MVDRHHKSILVSGESRAGKTKTIKIVLSHLEKVKEGGYGVNTSGGGRGGHHPDCDNPVVRIVLDSKPLLEVFGNSKTVHNNISLHFGKYLQLQFDVEDVTLATFYGRAIPSCVLDGLSCKN